MPHPQILFTLPSLTGPSRVTPAPWDSPSPQTSSYTLGARPSPLTENKVQTWTPLSAVLHPPLRKPAPQRASSSGSWDWPGSSPLLCPAGTPSHYSSARPPWGLLPADLECALSPTQQGPRSIFNAIDSRSTSCPGESAASDSANEFLGTKARRPSHSRGRAGRTPGDGHTGRGRAEAGSGAPWTRKGGQEVPTLANQPRAVLGPLPRPHGSPDPARKWAGQERQEPAHWAPKAPPPKAPPRGPRSQPQERAQRRVPVSRPPPATRRPPAAAPAAARCSASPSLCGADRSGPAPTPRSPHRLPGPPSSAHVTRRRRPGVNQLYWQQPGHTATRPQGWSLKGGASAPGPPPAPRPRPRAPSPERVPAAGSGARLSQLAPRGPRSRPAVSARAAALNRRPGEKAMRAGRAPRPGLPPPARPLRPGLSWVLLILRPTFHSSARPPVPCGHLCLPAPLQRRPPGVNACRPCEMV